MDKLNFPARMPLHRFLQIPGLARRGIPGASRSKYGPRIVPTWNRVGGGQGAKPLVKPETVVKYATFRVLRERGMVGETHEQPRQRRRRSWKRPGAFVTRDPLASRVGGDGEGPA